MYKSLVDDCVGHWQNIDTSVIARLHRVQCAGNCDYIAFLRTQGRGDLNLLVYITPVQT